LLILNPVSAQIEQDSILKVGYTSAPPFIIQNGEDLKGVNIWLWQQATQELSIQI